MIAPDKFKGSLTATEVAAALAEGLLAADSQVEVRTVPVADGGDGTVDAAVSAGFERRVRTVRGPLGTPTEAAFAVSNHTAVVELSEASGLRRLPPGVFDPLHSSTYGTGEMIRAPSMPWGSRRRRWRRARTARSAARRARVVRVPWRLFTCIR